jgi:signal transduction histidine kinase/ActR/RegA family two-component response regulator/HAMP domain-containing protein
MVDQLSAFASEVTRVAREVGTEGKLGGQAEVVGVSGTWQRLTESVNHLAGNLTTQVRAIAAVATAVTEGDLTRQITVDASGEVAELKDNINQMIANLMETTRTNLEQDWLKTNLARISGLMQGHHDLKALASLIMSELAPLVSAQYGALYLASSGPNSDDVVLERTASYGAPPADLVEGVRARFHLGESLVGQAAADRKTILMAGAPENMKIASGMGTVSPANVILVPVLFEGQTLGVIELGSVREFTPVHQDLLDQLKEIIGVNVNTIVANSRTEALLAESQRLASELRARSEQLQQQQDELQRSNTELAEKAALLASQNRDIEIKNIAIEQASQELEERAQQLSMASRYKSEFLANMSHELRTPLNSALILAKLLADNLDGNLTPQQIEFAKTIHAAGSDLLQMINDVLDLAKVEAGHMELLPVPVPVESLVTYVESLYHPLAADKGLDFSVSVSKMVPPSLQTDRQRLQQILRNLLSNAVKFTHEGSVRLSIRTADSSEVSSPSLRAAPTRVAFVVEDTGIGIPPDKLALIFDAFKQADGTTSRQYGGTGLGLSICRELTRLIGAELQVHSETGRGSTFTLYLTAGERPAKAALTVAGPETEPGVVQSRHEVRQLEHVETPPTQRTQWTDTGPRDTVPRDTGPWDTGPRDTGYGRPVGVPAAEPGTREDEPDGDPPWEPRDPHEPRDSRESADEPGTSLTLHAQAVPEQASPRESQQRPTWVRQNAKVLVVDDDPRYVYAITTTLEQHGLDVICVDNGLAGLRALEQHDDIRLVLMDVMMPALDGNATMATIRRMPRYHDLPLIAVTAKAMKGDREKSLSSGATEYVAKPVDIEWLLQLIASHLPTDTAISS